MKFLVNAIKKVLGKDELRDEPGDKAQMKDLDRLASMDKRSGGNREKLLQLAQQMANSIDKKDKALRRADAAEQVLDGKNAKDVAAIFRKRAKQL